VPANNPLPFRFRCSPIRPMSWANGAGDHDWLLEQWPWDPDALVAGLLPAQLPGSQLLRGLDLPGSVAGVAYAQLAPASRTGAGIGAAIASAISTRPEATLPSAVLGGSDGTLAADDVITRKRGRSAAAKPSGAAGKGARVAARPAAFVCRVHGCGVVLDSISAYCRRTRCVLQCAARPSVACSDTHSSARLFLQDVLGAPGGAAGGDGRRLSHPLLPALPFAACSERIRWRAAHVPTESGEA
jgi:hypothetical protein